jgi:hypothetical protein
LTPVDEQKRLSLVGKAFVCTVDMWMYPSVVIAAGLNLEVDPGSYSPPAPEVLLTSATHHQRVYQKLLTIYPLLEGDIMHDNGAMCRQIEKQVCPS